MRINFVTPAFDLSGGQRVIATYADRLVRRGHTVGVVAPPRPPVPSREVVRYLLGRHRWPYHRVDDHHHQNSFVALHTLDRVRPVVATDLPDADVVIATWWETAEWVDALPPSKGAKVYLIQHYEAFGYTPGDRVDATWRLPMSKVVVAPWLADLARERFADPTAHVVANAVDLDLFHAPPRGQAGTPTVGTMYSPVPFKGCDVSLRAVELATRQVPTLRLKTFGSRVERRLSLPNGSEHVVHPPQNRIRDIYAGCDAWLFGSRSEGFGLPILEAMACRTPVIGTPAGAAPELLAGGGGLLVEPENPVAMAEAIVRVCRMSEAEWRRMSDAAHTTATGYTWDDATDRFEQALLAAARTTDPATTHAP